MVAIKEIMFESSSVEFPQDSRAQAREEGLQSEISQDMVDEWKNISPREFAMLMAQYAKDGTSNPRNPVNWLPDDVLSSLFTEKNLMAAFSYPGIDYYDWREWMELIPDSVHTPRSAKYMITIDPYFAAWLPNSFGPEYMDYALDVADNMLDAGDPNDKIEYFIYMLEDSNSPVMNNSKISSKFQQLREKYKELND